MGMINSSVMRGDADRGNPLGLPPWQRREYFLAGDRSFLIIEIYLMQQCVSLWKNLWFSHRRLI
jgi:hypothetical protein